MNHAPVLLRQPPPAPGAERRLLSLPDLWDRARVLFARLVEVAGAPDQLRARRLGRDQRRDVLDWLHPVESLVRKVLVAKAITFLLMTPQGRAMMRPAPKTSASLRHQPEGTTRIVSIPHPGWHTIAQPYRPPPPPPPPPPARDPAARTRACFSVLGAREYKDLSPARGGRPHRSFKGMVSFLGGDDAPATRASRQMDEAPSAGAADAGVGASADARRAARAIALARRIEALSRAIAKPEPLVRRLARAIAAHADMVLAFVSPTTGELDRWRQGYPEFIDAQTHFRRARAALGRPHEPG